MDSTLLVTVTARITFAEFKYSLASFAGDSALRYEADVGSLGSLWPESSFRSV